MKPNGKKKEDEARDASLSDTADDKMPSLTQRIGSSTSGLLQSSFGTSSAGTVAKDLATLNLQGSKGASNLGSGIGSEASSSQFPLIGRERSGTDSLPALDPLRSDFGKGLHGAGTAQVAFDEFAVGSQAVIGDQTVSAPRPGKGLSNVTPQGDRKPIKALKALGSAERVSVESDSRIFQALASYADSNNGVGKRTGLFQDNEKKDEDGAAVVALLSDPTFAIDSDPADSWDYDANEHYGKYRKNTMSYDEPREPTFPDDAKAVPHPLDLVPDFNSSLEPHLSPTPERKDLQSVLKGIKVPNDGEIQPWIDILNKYQDEVWGDMLPFVREAREEVRATTFSENVALEERPAIRRLAMLLNHIKFPVG